MADVVARPFSSGDPAADRRAAYAETLALHGDLTAAIEVLSGALDLAPGWAGGWFRLGEYHERAGDTAAAAQAWERALAADPADPFGAGLKRDLLRHVPVAESMPPAFVEALFDQYAPRFDQALRGRLHYRGPEILRDQLLRCGFTRAVRALDLGCGTGLMGVVLRPCCDWLGGIDLSAGMLAEARAKGVYDRLDKGDIGGLSVGGAHYDLIVAVDVFAYLGALERIVAWCAGSLAPGGRLAFTVEAGDEPVMLRDSRRFAHSRSYIEGLLRDAGFAGVHVEDCVVRQDRGQDIAALAVVAADPAPRRALEGEGEAGVLA